MLLRGTLVGRCTVPRFSSGEMMRPKNLLQLFVRAGKAWSDDYAPSMGAAISYYTVFSLAPLLVIVIAVAGAVFGRQAVTGQIVAEIRGLVGDQGAAVVQNVVAASANTHRGLVAGIVSAVVLVIGATSVFTELQSSLDRIWHVPEAEKPRGVWNILRTRLLSFGVIMALVFLLMVSLVVSAGLSAMGDWASDVIPGGSVLLQVANQLISLAVATVLFAFVFKVLPSTRIAWRDVWVGAFTTAVLFTIGKFLIGLYLGKSSTTQAFAAAGSLVVFIAWVYYAAQIFLLGAEFTKVFAHEQGSRKGLQFVTARSQADAPAAQPQAVLPAAATASTSAAQAAPAAAPAASAASAASAARATPATPATPAAAPRPAAAKKPHPALPAAARLEETRHRLEVEVPPRATQIKKVAKGASAAAAGLATLALLALQLVRSRRGGGARRHASVLAQAAPALRKRASALAKRAPVLRKRGMLRLGA